MEEALRRRTVEGFDLAEEVRLRMGREQGLARRKGVALTLGGDGPLRLRGDREALLLALRNVLTNAIEWSPAGGPVAVRMGRSDGSIEVLVDDSGPGVPEGSRQVIFEPFHEGPAAQGRRVGFGLGLALTQGVVQAEGGSIEVLDSPLGGARFRILIPADEGDDSGREERLDPTSRSRAG
jgi:signal transduction histidine kinase